ncbi:peroxiredoxin [Halococcus saccharolyticus]|uniref:thioredoxin-dependent peroxiredoxin n=1 Tax=Halococcus saccharolyticus DSM 5350 TaxID=1227455 RepID=M0MML9_9EURY|nr:peroxiredoxin [Halococcus saccharolyticus]EMA46916.1 peroxiredoxin [Halococcus saccharolyticus DSM 5350]
MLEPGTQAPSFELSDENGEPVKLSDFAGQHRVVYFYPKAGTEGCRIEARSFRDSWQAFEDQDVQVFGISTDSVEDIHEFKQTNDIPFPLLSDIDGEVAAAYESYETSDDDGTTNTTASRNTYLVDPSGEIEAAFEDVSPDGHAAEVLDAITDS